MKEKVDTIAEEPVVAAAIINSNTEIVSQEANVKIEAETISKPEATATTENPIADSIVESGDDINDAWELKIEIYEESEDGVVSVTAYEKGVDFSRDYKAYFIDRKNQLRAEEAVESKAGYESFYNFHKACILYDSVATVYSWIV